jgi:prevent-host-death family protein
MRTLAVGALRDHLDEALREVATGEVIAVMDHGREIARIVPAAAPMSLKPLPSRAAVRAAMIANGAVVGPSMIVELREEDRE